MSRRLATGYPLVSACLVAAAIVVAGSTGGVALAQEPGPAVIEFGAEVAEGGMVVAAYVEGERCDEADLSVDLRLELGLSGQPEACGREGAAITIYSNPDGDCPTGCAAPHAPALFVRLGETQRIDVFIPTTPHSGPTIGPPAAGNLGLARTHGAAAGPALLVLLAAAIVGTGRAATSRR